MWPGVVAATLQWLAWSIVPAFAPQWGGSMIIVAVLFALAILIWWLFFSRAPWLERLGAIALMVVAVAATSRVVHESVANGMMGFMLYVYSIPVLSLALVAWAVASRHFSSGLRRASMVAAIVLACGTMTIIRTNGLSGDADSDLEWRWTPTSEQQLLSGSGDTPLDSAPGESAVLPSAPPPIAAPEKVPDAPSAGPVATSEESARATPDAVWPGFRGPERDSAVHGVQIATDWSRTPPVELWRSPIGPAWSSFAVRGDRLFTQEQRGDDEVVSAYNVKTGKPVWKHRDAARFWESNAGAGPRATPTLSHGRVYTLGGTGILNALDDRDGSVVWSRDATSDTGSEVPAWGIASSPLVVGDVVIVGDGRRTCRIRRCDRTASLGRPEGWVWLQLAAVSDDRWRCAGRARQWAWCDWRFAVRWHRALEVRLGGRQHRAACSPRRQGSSIGSGSGLAAKTGMLRVTVAKEPSGWSVKEQWTSNGLKAYFNDFVVHKNHAFGFDGGILACIDLADGTRTWKGGRYGHGQLILLSDQDLLLVLSEEGELALVNARSDKFAEVARFKAIEGKTWNHPVLARDILLVRNGEEMAAFRLSLADR